MISLYLSFILLLPYLTYRIFPYKIKISCLVILYRYFG